MRLGAFHDRRVDTWCVGCLLVHIRSGKLPFLYLWEDPGVAEDERRLRRSGACLVLCIVHGQHHNAADKELG
jgi:hypothetical protein